MTETLAAPLEGQLRRVRLWALVVGAAALALCALGAALQGAPTGFFRAYLVAFVFFLGIPLGCLVILMIYHLTGGAWGYLVRRILEAGTRTLPLLGLLFLPLLFGLPELYVWARPGAADELEGLRHKQIYLNVPFFTARAVLYFALWIGWMFLLNGWSRRQDRTGDPALAPRMGLWSAIGLIMFGITITFASVDWVMSLQPAFRSSIFGPLVASGMILTGMAAALVVLDWLVIRPPREDAVSPEALNDLGNLLFTFLVVWAYMEFFQFMLIWMANLPYDIIWYLPRSRGGWQYVAWALFVLHLAVPFFLLLMRDVKRNPRALAVISGVILFMHLVFLYHQVLPAFPDDGAAGLWMDFVMPLGVGGLWLSYFLWTLPRLPLLPVHDENRRSAIHLHRLADEHARREEELQHG